MSGRLPRVVPEWLADNTRRTTAKGEPIACCPRCGSEVLGSFLRETYDGNVVCVSCKARDKRQP